MPSVILTNEQGASQGLMDIIEAHTGEGSLHKAFSAYIFRKNGTEILLQQRSTKKMLFPLFWANTCCSHPRENEDIIETAERRLQEECGFTCPLKEVTSFVYRAADPEGRGVEHERDTILRGDVEEIELNPDPDEIAELQWIPVNQLLADMKSRPERYAPWFHLGLKLVLEKG